MNRPVLLLVLVLLASSASVRAGYDECDAGFIAFLGADTDQFSPTLEGDLGRVRLCTVHYDK